MGEESKVMNIRLFLAFVLACLTCAFAGAQTNGGDIDGTLLDESGHPAAEVSITIENTSTERLHNATTDENGRFHFESLPAGEYEIVTDLGQTEPAIFEIRADRVVRIDCRQRPGVLPRKKPRCK